MYLGNQPATNFETVRKDRFTGLTGTNVSLSYAVTSVNDIIVWVNSVKQDYNNYTVSGSTLTLGGALVSADIVEIAYIARTFQSVNPPAGSVGASQITDGTIGLSKLSATGTKDSTTFLRGDNTFASAGGTMTPAWSVSLSATQNISDSVYAKVNFDSVFVDTDSAYDNTTNYRWTCPSGKGGKYFIHSSIHLQSGSNSNMHVAWSQIRKNGTAISNSIIDPRSSLGRQFNSTKTIIENISAGDYLECWGYIVSGSGAGQAFGGGNSGEDLFKTTFGGFKIIE